MNRAAILWVVLLWSSAVAAGQVQTRRDTEARPTTGTASIAGVVVTDETPPQPVRRAIVTLTSDDLRPSRGAITDDDGRFALSGLPAGRFILAAMRASFVTSQYGAKRAGRPGTPISLTDGQTQNVVVRLWRGAVIAGVLRDDTGEPVAGIPVTAERISGSGGGPALTLSNNGIVVTNDRGEYRIFGLEPGRYLVSARPASGGVSPMIALATQEVDAALEALRRRSAPGTPPAPVREASTSSRPFDYAPIYHPGTPARVEAIPVTLAAGQEAGGLDFALQRIVTSVVEGQLMRPDGQPAGGAEVQLTPIGIGDFAMEQELILNAAAGTDGRFQFRQVTPGEYRLVARVTGQPARAAPTAGVVTAGVRGTQFWSATTLSVRGDIAGVTLTVQAPLTLTGRVRFESATLKPPADLTQLRAMLLPPDLQSVRSGVPVRSIAFVPPATVRADGTFEIANIVPGRFVLTIAGQPIDGTPWWPRSAMLAGRDLFDGRIEISGDMNLTGVEVTFTDRRSEVSGTLQTAAGEAVSDVFVIAFAADRRAWGSNARRVQAVRPGIDGGYAIKDLPAGEYLLAAVTDADQDEWQDPAFLERLLPLSVKLTVREGEKITLNLRVGGS